jgi:hypothetical protein
MAVSWAALLLLATGCEQPVHKADSTLRLEKAEGQVQLLVDKANTLLKPNVLAAPRQHLHTIVYAKKVSDEALEVFSKQDIRDWQHPELTILRDRLLAMQPELLDYAIDLLMQTTQKTILLRKRLQEVKNIPYGAKGTNVDKMVRYLSKEFNVEIHDCCLVNLSRINELLILSPKKYAELIKLSRYIYPELEEIIRNEGRGVLLLSRLEKIRAAHRI